MAPVITARGVSKRYRLGEGLPYRTLRDLIASAARSMRPAEARESVQEVWALDDVSFDINEGEVVGIIGRNGAGKSTLLKILSRITEPTRGELVLHGRVGALLEVGTGFHPELTGRENVYLSGAILGMRRAEITARFDEIVAFAELERFLDTPVKRYSSGMFLRLGFAVAAHLQPDILIVDEVLAVGDQEFQRKSLGKMEEVGASGRTVLFVSHNLPAIVRLCSRVILLDRGRIAAVGRPQEIAGLYMHEGGNPAERTWPAPHSAPGDDVARLRAVRVLDDAGQLRSSIDLTEAVTVEVEYWNFRPDVQATVSLQFFNEEGTCLFCSNDFSNLDWWNTTRRPGLVSSRCRVPPELFTEGQVYVLSAVCSYNPDLVHALERDAVSFHVTENPGPDAIRGPYGGNWPGVVRPRLPWRAQVMRDLHREEELP